MGSVTTAGRPARGHTRTIGAIDSDPCTDDTCGNAPKRGGPFVVCELGDLLATNGLITGARTRVRDLL